MNKQQRHNVIKKTLEKMERMDKTQIKGRFTPSWKHQRKDRRQYIRTFGKDEYAWYPDEEEPEYKILIPMIIWGNKRDTPFMQDDKDPVLMTEN